MPNEVVTFLDYQPPQRFDGIPWTAVRIEEAATGDGAYAVIETVPLSPVDADPANPAYRSFTTENGTAPAYWYRVVFADADGDLSQPTSPVQNVPSTSYAAVYATVDDLKRVLGKPNPTPGEHAAMVKVLQAAADEINWDVGYSATNPAPSPVPSIVADVNLNRAAELWRFNFSTSGVLPQGPDIGVVVAPRDTWNRHHLRLNPLRLHVGIA